MSYFLLGDSCLAPVRHRLNALPNNGQRGSKSYVLLRVVLLLLVGVVVLVEIELGSALYVISAPKAAVAALLQVSFGMMYF